MNALITKNELSYNNPTTEELLNRTRDNDVHARNQLVMQNEKLIHYTIQYYNYLRYKHEYEDMYQDGMLGLISGIEQYSKSDRVFKLSTFAVRHIRTAINRAIQNYQMIQSPINAIGQHYTVQSTTSKLKREHGRKITPREIEKVTGISVKRQAVTHKTATETIPFYDPSCDKIGESLHRKGHLSKFASHLIHHQRRVEERIENKIVINNALHSNRLNDREKITLRSIYGLVDDIPLTLEETGDILNVTRERVRQIHVKALRKLRHPAVSKNLTENITYTPKRNRPKIK